MNKNLTFYFIRHGRTVWNEQGLMQGSGNSDLTEEGIQGAVLTGKTLKEIPFSAVYTSCLQRTIDTAKHILAERQIPLFQHQGLNEHRFGSWEGQQIVKVRELDEFQQMINDPANYKALSNGGETWEQLATRAMNAIQDIIQIHHQGNILIVSHGHTLRLLLSLLAGYRWQEHRDENKSQSLRNTSISIVHYRQNEGEKCGRFFIEKINDTTHLD